MRSRLLLAMLFVLGGWSPPAHAQGCAVCKNAVADAPVKTQRAFRHGITMLVLPATGVIFAFGVILFKHRRSNT